MSSSDSADGATGVESRLVRTTGRQSTAEDAIGGEDGGGFDAPGAREEINRLRTRVVELDAELERTATALETREARIEELIAELDSARRERDDAREWAEFLDDELREHREHVETLEERAEVPEAGPAGLLDRLRGLVG